MHIQKHNTHTWQQVMLCVKVIAVQKLQVMNPLPTYEPYTIDMRH